MKIITRSFMFALLLLFCSTLIAQSAEPVDAVPEAIQAWIEGWNSKTMSTAEKGLASDFTIKDVPQEYVRMVLQRVFPQASPQILACRVKNIKKLGKGANYAITLVMDTRMTECDFELNSEGKITSTDFFPGLMQGEGSKRNTALRTSAEQNFTTDNGLILLEAELDGEKGLFILDSGAPVMVLNTRHSGKNQAQGLTMARGIGGNVKSISTRKVEKFAWSGGVYRDFEAIAMDLGHLEQVLSSQVLGLISQAEMEPFETYLDYSAKKLNLYGLKPDGKVFETLSIPKARHSSSFEPAAHLPVFKIKIGKQNLKMALDTGAQSNLIDLSLQKKFSKELTDTSTDTILGADNNPASVSTGKIPTCKFGKLEYAEMLYAFSDISHLTSLTGSEFDGLLGYPFLVQYPVSINYRKKTISVY